MQSSNPKATCWFTRRQMLGLALLVAIGGLWILVTDEIVITTGKDPKFWDASGQEVYFSSNGKRDSNFDSLFSVTAGWPLVFPKTVEWHARVPSGFCDRLAPDGTTLLYETRGSRPEDLRLSWPSNLSLARAPDFSPVELVTDELLVGCPAWAPDSQQFAVIVEDGWAHRLEIFDTEGHRRTLYTVRGGSWLMSPAWSPDGRKIALRLNDWLVIVPIAGGQPIELGQTRVQPDHHNDPEAAVAGAPSWAPDSERLVYAEGDLGGLGSLVILSLTDSHKTYLRRFEWGKTPYRYAEPLWSPDGRYIAANRILAAANYTVFSAYELVLIRVPSTFKWHP